MNTYIKQPQHRRKVSLGTALSIDEAIRQIKNDNDMPMHLDKIEKKVVHLLELDYTPEIEECIFESFTNAIRNVAW